MAYMQDGQKPECTDDTVTFCADSPHCRTLPGLEQLPGKKASVLGYDVLSLCQMFPEQMYSDYHPC